MARIEVAQEVAADLDRIVDHLTQHDASRIDERGAGLIDATEVLTHSLLMGCPVRQEAILGVHELNEIALLKDVFLWAYERSAAQYAAVRQSLGEPDPFRLKYRTELRDALGHIIRSKVGRREVADEISRLSAKSILAEDRAAFANVVEEELLSLHAGNVARFRVRPSEFSAWQEKWTDT